MMFVMHRQSAFAVPLSSMQCIEFEGIVLLRRNEKTPAFAGVLKVVGGAAPAADFCVAHQRIDIAPYLSTGSGLRMIGPSEMWLSGSMNCTS
ncbi:hypothetical protein AB4084_29970, partial [Lysobacter sp. 2RAB21]